MATKIRMIVYYWKNKRSIFKQKCFSKNNLKQYSSIVNACSIIFWRKLSDTLFLLLENNSLLFLNHSNKISNQAKFLCLILTVCKMSNESNKRLLRYCTLIFSMSCMIASVTSYLSENDAKICKMATSILLKFLTLKWDISRTIWCIEVSDGSFFCIFHTLSFDLNSFFDRRFPLIMSPTIENSCLPMGLISHVKHSFHVFDHAPKIFERDKRFFLYHDQTLEFVFYILLHQRIRAVQQWASRKVVTKFSWPFSVISGQLNPVVTQSTNWPIRKCNMIAICLLSYVSYITSVDFYNA